MRRKEKEITDKEEMINILENAEYITIAMSRNNEPYLVTLSHGYDRNQNCIYFHCAKEGKKIDFLNEAYEKETNPERKERLRNLLNNYHQSNYYLEHMEI